MPAPWAHMIIFRTSQIWTLPPRFNHEDNEVWAWGAGGHGQDYVSAGKGGAGGGGGSAFIWPSPIFVPAGTDLTIQVGIAGAATSIGGGGLADTLVWDGVNGMGGARGAGNGQGFGINSAGGESFGQDGGIGGHTFGGWNWASGGAGSAAPARVVPNGDIQSSGFGGGATIGTNAGGGGGGGCDAPFPGVIDWDNCTSGTSGGFPFHGIGGVGQTGIGNGTNGVSGTSNTGGGGGGGKPGTVDGGDGASWDYILSLPEAVVMTPFDYTLAPYGGYTQDSVIMTNGTVPAGGGGGGGYDGGDGGDGGYPGGGGGGAGVGGTPGLGRDGLVIIFWNDIACGVVEEPCEEITGTCGSIVETPCVATWPTELQARSIGIYPIKATIGGGPALPPGMENVSGTQNGFWRFALNDILITTADQVRKWRQMEIMLEGAANAICVSLCEGKRAPWDTVGVPIEAVANSNFVVGSVSGSIKMTAGGALLPGMHFSVGERLYKLKTVGAPSGSPAIYPVTLWPVVRAAIAVNDSLEFVNLTCKARLRKQDGMSLDLDLLRYANASVEFEEDI